MRPSQEMVGLQLQFCQRTFFRPLTPLSLCCVALRVVHTHIHELSLQPRYERVHILWERVNDLTHLIRFIRGPTT